MAGETMTQEEISQFLKDQGIDIKPSLHAIKVIIRQSKRISELEKELGEALKDKENWREIAASYQAQLNKAQSELANLTGA